MADFTGSILDIKGDRATVITNNCDFVVIKRSRGMSVGHQVSFNKADIYTLRKNNYRKYMSIAASVCVIIFSYFLYYQFFMPSKVFAYIDVDINPSIEFSVDKDKQVLEVKPLNSDAEQLLKNEKLNGLPIAEAITELIKECEKEGIIKTDSGAQVLVAGARNTDKNKIDTDKNKKLLESMLTEIDNAIEGENGKNSAEYIKINPQERALAIENNISMGRYSLYNKINEEGSDISVEQAKKSKVSEMLDKAKGKIHTEDSSVTDKSDSGSEISEPENVKNNEGQSNDKNDNGKKQNGDNVHSSNKYLPKIEENVKQNSSDTPSIKKENGNSEKNKSGENSEVKENGEKSDSRGKVGSAVTPTPDSIDIPDKGKTDDDSKKSSNEGNGNSQKEVKTQEKGSDNEKNNKSDDINADKNKK